MLIRNFVEDIEVEGDEATLTYTVPMPSDGTMSESASVLDFVKSSPPCLATRVSTSFGLPIQHPGQVIEKRNCLQTVEFGVVVHFRSMKNLMPIQALKIVAQTTAVHP